MKTIIDPDQPNTLLALASPPAQAASGSSPTATAALIAELGEDDVVVVEATLARVKDSCHGGDRQAIEGALIDQAVLLQALGVKLLKVAGSEGALPRIQVFTNLSLRAFEGARKSLGMIQSAHVVPQSQTNVQVNVGGNTNELLEGR